MEEWDVYAYPLQTTHEFAVGEKVFVWLKSDRDTGRAIITSRPGCEPEHTSDHTSESAPQTSFQDRYQVRFDCDGSTCHVRTARILPVFPLPTATASDKPPTQLTHADHVVDIGCSYGKGTAVIAEHCGFVTGIDISEECITSAQESYQGRANMKFENYDVLEYRERLTSQLASCTRAFVDIGGNREIEALVSLIPLLVAQPLTLIVVKSKELVKSLIAQLTGGRNCVVDPVAWWRSVEAIASESESRHVTTARKRSKKYHLVNSSEDTQAGFGRYPLRYPPRENPDGLLICRYHNYGVCVADKYGRVCQYDHDHCHYCGAKGHIAKNCEVAAREALRASE